MGVFKPDSFTHTLSKRTEDLSSDEASLLDIKVKEKLKRLSEKENSVYASIVKGKQIGLLSPTTTVNKKIFFTDVEKNKLGEKTKKLKKYLLDGASSEKIISDLSEFNFSEKEIQKLNKYMDKAKEKAIEIKQKLQEY